MSTNITPVINAVIALLFALFTAFVLPATLRKVGADIDAKSLEKLLAWVKIAVAAAEQLFASTQGQDKLQYVLKFLADKGFTVDTEEIHNAVEAEVLKLHTTLYGARKAEEAVGDD